MRASSVSLLRHTGSNGIVFGQVCHLRSQMDGCMHDACYPGRRAAPPNPPLKILPLFETGLPGLNSHRDASKPNYQRASALSPGATPSISASQQIGMLNLHPRRHLPIAEYLTTKQLDK